MGAWISNYSGTNTFGANYRHGWRAYATEAEAQADQDSLEADWRDGVEYRAGDVEPGDEWEG